MNELLRILGILRETGQKKDTFKVAVGKQGGKVFLQYMGFGLPGSMSINLTWLGHELPRHLVKHSGDVSEGVFQRD